MKRSERLEKALKVIEELKELSSEVPIIVEGKRDRDALRKLGIDGKIYTISMPIEELSERVAVTGAREAIILTDYDRTGRTLAGKLKRLLMNEGIRPNFTIRRKLKHLVGFEFVEELPSLLLELVNE